MSTEPPCASCDAVKRVREEARGALLAGLAFAVAVGGWLRARRALSAYVLTAADLNPDLTHLAVDAPPADATEAAAGGQE
jgi:hypothetical protein